MIFVGMSQIQKMPKIWGHMAVLASDPVKSQKLSGLEPGLYLDGRHLMGTSGSPSEWYEREFSWWPEGPLVQICEASLLLVYPRVALASVIAPPVSMK